MLDQFTSGLVAVVSDSFNIFDACKELWGNQLREKILDRDGTLVVRPDSGDPPEVVVQVLELLAEQFGTSINEKGYRVLPPQIRVIQGDGIDREMLQTILNTMKETGWSADNVAFGSGGGLLQKLNRDTSKYAFKCASATVDGQQRDVFKQPVTDNGKKSKAGRMKLVRRNGQFATIRNEDKNHEQDELITVFHDGELLKDYNFSEVRSNAAIGRSAN